MIFIQNFYPISVDKSCGVHLFYIATEFQLLAILVPLFLFIYKVALRKVLIAFFVVVGLLAGIFPMVYYTLKNGDNAYPMFIYNG